MNQILKPEQNMVQKPNNLENTSKKKNYTIYQVQFFFSFFIAISLLVIFFTHAMKMNENEKLSKQLVGQYQISTLYAKDSPTSTPNPDTNTFSQTPFVIGILKIDKIGLNYPILSQTSPDLLDLSLCRFAGPMPNEIGNLCIAGHNYIDDRLFGKLDELELTDTVQVYDLTGNMIEYAILGKYEVSANDTSCTSQNTNGKKTVTLLTCNNVTQKRLVIVANEIVKSRI